MIERTVHRLLKHRHFWRDIEFNELNEIYVAMLVRGLSLSMIGLFVPVYMLRLDYSLSAFLTVQVFYFATRVFADFGAARLVAKFGPKHVMVFGQMLFTVASVLFLTLESMNWPLWLLGAVWGASQSCFFISFDVDFSKIKHKLHGGKELGYVEIMSKVGAVLGPIIGGVIGLIFGPQYIFAASTILLVVGLSPLFKTREPMRLNQKLHYRNFPAKYVSRFMPSVLAVNIENTLSIMIWPVFLTLFILPGDSVFIKIGILSAVSVLAGIIAAYVFGHVVDRKQGRTLMCFSAVMNAVLHLLRPFVGSYPVAFGLNIANDVATIGYRLPFFKSYYDQADEYPGYRIVFISVLEALSSLSKGTVYAILLMVSMFASNRTTLTVAFAIAAIASLIITTAKFKTLAPTQHKGA